MARRIRVRDPRRAQVAAVLAGILLFLTGSTGALATVAFGRHVVSAANTDVAWFLGPVFAILAFLAALGGITVLVGAWLLTRHRVAALVLIYLGSGVGILTLLAGLLALLTGGRDATSGALSAALSVQGLAVMLLLYARWKA